MKVIKFSKQAENYSRKIAKRYTEETGIQHKVYKAKNDFIFFVSEKLDSPEVFELTEI